MADVKETLGSIQKNMTRLARECPEFMQGFQTFHNNIESNSGLDVKTMELILVALGVNRQCTYCIDAHIARALKAGATRKEILAAAQAAVLMGGGPTLMYTTEHLLKTLDELGA
ncbi:MAG: carboxymuconolactone decarboxylase family protein [Phycisphaerae bacterium]|nr:carboxymuconolactone decarboxylase family protein [Phycisphaerae bacterium]